MLWMEEGEGKWSLRPRFGVGIDGWREGSK